MLKYARSQATEQGSFRQLMVLRGPPGVGKSTWALEQLQLQLGVTDEEEDIAKLTHICAVDDFPMKARSSSGNSHQDEPDTESHTVELAHSQNEARVRLCMEVGIQPLYVDASNLQLWEMAPYVSLAQQAGYDITFVQPSEIFDDWKNAEALLARCVARTPARSASKTQLKKLVGLFEEMTDSCEEDTQKILKTKRTPGRAMLASMPSDGASTDESASLRGTKRPVQIAAGAKTEAVAKVARQADKSEPMERSSPEIGLEPNDASSGADSILGSMTFGRSEEASTAASLLKSFTLRGTTRV